MEICFHDGWPQIGAGKGTRGPPRRPFCCQNVRHVQYSSTLTPKGYDQ